MRKACLSTPPAWAFPSTERWVSRVRRGRKRCKVPQGPCEFLRIKPQTATPLAGVARATFDRKRMIANG